jgi:hypothetical protein
MNSLINNVDSLWEEIKKAIDRFWDSFDNLSSMP